jgi:prevent-host-death family protein
MLGHNDRYDHNGLVKMITETSAVKLRQNLGEMLNQVQYRRDSVLINKDGKPVAALVDARLFQRIRRMQDRFDSLCARIEAGFRDVPQETGMTEIAKAISLERAKVRRATTKAAKSKPVQNRPA